MNKRFFSGLSVLVIIALVGFLWVVMRREVDKISVSPEVKQDIVADSPSAVSDESVKEVTVSDEMATRAQDSVVKVANDCAKNTIKEFGEMDVKKDAVVYQTECIIKVYPNDETDSLARFYIRATDGSFNKEIYRTLNTPSFKGETYGEIVGVGNDKIRIQRSTGPDDSIVLEPGGDEFLKLSEAEASDEYLASLSPGGKYQALVGYPDASEASPVGPNKIKITDLETQEVTEYDFSENEINGTEIAGWSSDGKTVYVIGGVYEFYAPAKLWQINISEKQMKKIAGLDGLAYPVTVFPDEQTAFASDAKDNKDEEEMDIALYKINITDGSRSKIASEKAIAAFDDLTRVGGDMFYTVYNEEVESQLNKINLATNKVAKVKDGPAEIAVSDFKNWIIINDNEDYKLLFPVTGKEEIVGAGDKAEEDLPETGLEYLVDVVGWIKGK